MRDNLKVTIGCRVDIKFREKLIEMQEEGRYNSFSQFLEELIIEAVENREAKAESKTNENEAVLSLLKEIQTEQYNTEQNILEAISEMPVARESISLDADESTRELFIERLAMLLDFNYENEEQLEIMHDVFFDEDTTPESFFEFILLAEREEDWLDEKLQESIDKLNLLPIELNEESRALLLEYFNYLVKNSHAVSLEGALVGSIYNVLHLNKGGFLKNGFYGWETYSKKFEQLNEKIVKEG